ncbi:MAG: DUF1636 domain-containing protein [Novosphingobium sp.]|nr:DUF1636 domain-containing protein [Novosphingobium sp.]
MPGLDRQGWPSGVTPGTASVSSSPSSHRPEGPVIVTVCTSCRAPGADLAEAPGRALYDATVRAAEGAACQVRPTQCLSVCKRICSASISAAGGYTFVFGDLDPATAGADLVTLAEACAVSPYGFVAWRDRPQAIRSGIIARVPPPDWSPDDGGAPA